MSSNKWGYYDHPDRFDNPIGWLDDKDEREKKLKRQLQDWSSAWRRTSRSRGRRQKRMASERRS